MSNDETIIANKCMSCVNNPKLVKNFNHNDWGYKKPKGRNKDLCTFTLECKKCTFSTDRYATEKEAVDSWNKMYGI